MDRVSQSFLEWFGVRPWRRTTRRRHHFEVMDRRTKKEV